MAAAGTFIYPDFKLVQFMKLKEGFLLREIAGRVVVVPSADTLDLSLMISLNGTGRFLWERLEKGASHEQLVAALMDAYEVTEELAEKDVSAFVEKLRQNNCLE